MRALSIGDRITILLELRGGPQYAQGMRGASAATTQLGRSATGAAGGQARLSAATSTAGKEMPLFARRTFLANQALFTLRRYAFYATLAITALFGAGLRAGFQFNNTMQQGMILMTQFLGSAQAARDEMSKLFRLAVYSPFLFKDVVTATTIMMRLGVTAGDTNRTIKNIVDALAGIPNSTSKLNRAAFAIGHMATLGRVTGRVLQQLSMDNIPLVAALEKEFGLTGAQLQQVAKLGIPASAALLALNTYIEQSPQYAGNALRITMKSLGGLYAAFKDFFSQTAGLLVRPLYDSIQRLLFRLVKPGGLLDQMSHAGARRGATGALTVLSRFVGGGDVLAKGLVNLAHIVSDLWQIFIRSFIPAIIIAGRILSMFAPVLKITAYFMGVLAHHTTLLRVVLIPLAIIWLTIHGRLLLVWAATRLLTIATFGLFKVEGLLLMREKLLLLWQLRNIKVLKEYLFATKLVGALEAGAATRIFVKTGRWAKLGRAIFGAAIAARAFAAAWASPWVIGALLSNPITAVIALTAAIVILYFTWSSFRNAVNDTAKWIWEHWPYVSIVLREILGPIGMIIDAVKALTSFWKILYGVVTKPGKVGLDFLKGLSPIPIPGKREKGWISKAWHWISPFQAGGDVPYFGHHVALVGERGPELAVFPGGTNIIPHNELMSGGLSMQTPHRTGDGRPIIVQVMLNRKVLAEAVAKTNSDYQADA